MNWLDTRTKALLQNVPDDKSAPPKAAEFALVLLRKGPDRLRMLRAITEINKCSQPEAIALEKQALPVTINLGLREEEALWGQFELICCDAISIFLRSEIVEQNDQSGLSSLYGKFLESAEFKPTRVEILELPGTEAGEKFVHQFLGGPPTRLPTTVFAPYKEARIMHHWARRIGGEVQLDFAEPEAGPKD